MIHALKLYKWLKKLGLPNSLVFQGPMALQSKEIIEEENQVSESLPKPSVNSERQFNRLRSKKIESGKLVEIDEKEHNDKVIELD